MTNSTWVTLRTFETQPLAELARVALLNAGIPCRILNAEVVSMDWLLGNAVGYIPLQVPEDQLEAADEALGGESAVGEMPPSDCPKCGEPLNDDGACPMCGHAVEPSPDFPAAPQGSGEPAEISGDEFRPGTLEGLRSLGKSAIAAYLFVVLISAAAAVLGFLMAMIRPF